MPVDKSKYVVLDIETNGLEMSDDILSISLYRPDNGKTFNRYLPLELASKINLSAARVNGITKKMLDGAKPLTQGEVDKLIEDFELEKRTILTYSDFDRRMLKGYFDRKGLRNFDVFKFFNFKKDIISSHYSEGNITKDNLCTIYGIDGVQEQHTSLNDCILEWKLFEMMDGNRLFITQGKVFELNEEYIIPAGYIESHPKIKKCIPNLPYLKVESDLLERFELEGKQIKKFGTNVNGLIIEHLINTMVGAEKQHNEEFLFENKCKLNYLGQLPSVIEEIPLVFMPDGFVREMESNDRIFMPDGFVKEVKSSDSKEVKSSDSKEVELKKLVVELNKSTHSLKEQLTRVSECIKEDIFANEPIKSQELIVNKKDNILALCDLSTEKAVLEIKTTTDADISNFKYQLYYQAAGRKTFFLRTDWSLLPEKFAIEIYKVNVYESEAPLKGRKKKSEEEIERRIDNKNISLACYCGRNKKLTLKCNICEREWQESYYKATTNAECPFCKTGKNKVVSQEDKEKWRKLNYHARVIEKSGGKITVQNYSSSKSNVTAECLNCGHVWNIRADHLMERSYCPKCKATKQ